ncbi:putative histone H2A.4 [Diplonema papillatum]|nr:putative histone H2A.4 [Diplonema papillatum]
MVKASKSLAQKANLTFPAGRITGALKRGRYAKRVSPMAGVFLSAVLEFCTKEVMKLAKEAACRKKQKHHIKPRHICLAVREDEELNALLSKVTIAGGGVVSEVHGAMVGKKKTKSASSGKVKKPKAPKAPKKDKKSKDKKKSSSKSPKKSSPKKE